MRSRPTIWILVCLLLAAGAWLSWRSAEHRTVAEKFNRSITSTVISHSTAPNILTVSTLSSNAIKSLVASAKTNRFAFRVSNTTKTIGELMRDDKAILLDNALIETGAKLNLSIPKHLQSQGDPGSYIVQSRGAAGNAFRTMLASAGAQIVSYIPNNAYLVRVPAGGASALAANSLVQSVIPYEPYYKISSSRVTSRQKTAAWSPSETNQVAGPTLLGLAVENKPLPVGTSLTLGLFGDTAAATVVQVEQLGGKILSRENSPFGLLVRVQPPANWTALAALPGVMVVEPNHTRKIANDLARVTLGVSADTLTPTNYLGLSGKNVTVEVNDTGIDAGHPDFSATGTAASGAAGPTRVFGDAVQSLTDTNGHGTHVAGIIAGNGSMSLNPVNVGTEAEGSVSNADFRGKAPLASLYVIGGVDGGNDTNVISDSYFQQAAALTNALISNNSWVFDGDNAYDLEAASYDAATRDAIPGTPGSQPVLFVFAAGNSGDGDDDGGGGDPDTIMSPATGKNVLAVGALEELRNITNVVTNADGTVSTPWQKMTDSSFQVAGYSSRGNVGIGTEGTFGRYKPDVVAPGTFVVSTRSEQWDTNAYYNVTNDSVTQIIDLLEPDSLTDPPLQFFVFNNAVSVTIQANTTPGSPFVALPIYVWEGADINGPPTTPAEPDPITLPATPPNTEWACAASNTTPNELIYQLTVDVQTKNDLGDYYQVLEGMNDSLGGFYRYESGTSMAAPAVSGVLALMQDFFTNTLHVVPSPALLKAMLINGSRPTGNYDFNTANSINFQGWGLINLPDSLPLSVTNFIPGSLASSTSNSLYLVDQSPTNTLATGDSHTYIVKIADPAAQSLPLRVTLAWTDPPGNPAAAIKLVNDLNLVVTNLDDPANPVIYYGNDIPASSVFNSPTDTNLPPNVDSINNVENVFLPPLLGTNYSITIVGNRVNVNAVTAQTNNAAGNFAPNVSQDFALVISCGEGEVSDALAVTDMGTVSSLSPQITGITSTNTALLNQIVGANPPLLDTNEIPIGTNTVWGTNGLVTLGLTNQWHFYIVMNNARDSSGNFSDVTNAAFITFLPSTLSIPREGVFADSDADSTRPEADIDLYVTTDSNLLVLSPLTISNCLNGAQVGASSPPGVSGIFNSASLGRGGTEFVVDTNSTSGQVYYVGVKSEDRMASEYNFISIFTSTPFSQTDTNGNVNVNGSPVPVNIPDGSPAHPGVQYVFGLALDPTVEAGRVIVTNVIMHQNFGDLFGTLSHNGTVDVLNSHDSPSDPPPPGPYTMIYDDSGQNDVPNSQPSDGPGSLNSFVGNQAFGAWILTEVDNSQSQTGSIQNFTMQIQPHQSLLGRGIHVTIQPQQFFTAFIDVPNGFTNLSVFATNLPPTITPLPLQLFLNEGVPPTADDFLFEADLTNCPPGLGTYPTGTDPGNSISDGPPLQPDRYWVGIFNPSTDTPANVLLLATLGGVQVAPQQTDFSTSGPPILDDAVTTNSIFVSATNQIVSVNVGLVVDHPRISDLTFTLVSPSGQRVLLMENRGGLTATNLGDVFYTTNFFPPQMANGGAAPQTNSINVGQTSGQLTITYNFFTAPDEMTIYYGTNSANFNTNSPDFILDTGFTNNPPDTNLPSGPQNTLPENLTINFGPGTSTYVTIIMNQFGNTNSTTEWTYTAGGIQTNYSYATFTEDTNLTQTPIKFAVPPFDMTGFGTNFALSDFELATNGDYFGATNIFDAFGGWNMFTNALIFSNEVSVVTDPSAALAGSNYLALADGTISRTIPLTIGQKYSINYWYRGPGIAGWWRGEGNATDSSDPENNGNNGSLIGRFDFPAGEVGQAFQFEDAGADFEFAGTNTYIQIRQSPSLDVGARGGLTVEGWINPTNFSHQEPLMEWLSQMPTNGSDTNLVIEAGPFLDRATDHYYYLLSATNWVTSEFWATQLGGHLVTVDTANEENWVFDTFGSYGNTNRNLWIGLTNNAGSFVWSSGLTNIVYTNWANGQPNNTCGTADYTFIVNNTTTNAPNTNSPGLWALGDNNGFTCANPTTTNLIYGVVEVDELQTNGVQFWISVTNTPGTTNWLINAAGSIVTNTGCLYANLVDVSNLSHEIFSATGLIQSNIYQHVALTYSTNTGIANLYYNGTNVASTNLDVFIPKTGGDVLLGKDMSLDTNNYYGGEMDEMSIYSRPLSDAEIRAIYEVSNLSTNRNVGKFDPSVTPAQGLAEAQVSFGGTTNLIFGENNIWQEQGFSFTAVTNSASLQFKGLEPGMLLDSFNVSAVPLGNLYYFPEQSLDELDGTPANGSGISGQTNAWTLEIWDNRTGAIATNADLINWQLQFVLQSNVLATPLPLDPQDPTSITVPPGQIVYLAVDVPSWANFATNILVSSSGPVDVWFNPTNPPTGNNPGDFEITNNSTGGICSPDPLSATSNPPLPTNSYFLGVRNNGTHAVTAVVEVDFDITTLSNNVPFSGVLNTNDSVRYFAFDVSSNAFEATFQLLHLSGNADLVVRKGAPLPTLLSSDYGSFNATNADENIYVLTNSSPVPLSQGRWYLGVFKRDAGPVDYTVLAKELDATNGAAGVTIIDLTNGVPFDFTAGSGSALTNFFRFTVTNTITSTVTNLVSAIRFQLYNLSGNGDLTVQTDAPPFAPPFFQSSQNPSRDEELIDIRTNNALTNLAASWYLGVPDNETNQITYTILAVIVTNNVFPAFPGAEGAGAGALGGRGGDVYHVVNLNDDGLGSLRYGINNFFGTGATNVPGTGTTNLADGSITNIFGARTIVFDISGTITNLSPFVVTNSYLTIAGQTAPGDGITIAGNMTTVESAHDVVIRYIRFRPDYLLPEPLSSGDSLGLTNVSDMVADHVSASWGTNDILSALNSSNVTVQWSMIADSLNDTNAPHGYGSVLRYGGGTLSFHHNLYADNYDASPRLGDNLKLDFVNNVIYDWGTNAGFSTNETIIDDPLGFTNELNYECNYLIAGSNSVMTNIAFWSGTTNTWIFQTNNFIDGNINGILDGDDIGWRIITNHYTQFDRPFTLPPVTIDEAFLAYERVLDFAGAAMDKRDAVDTNIVGGVRSQTGVIISTHGLLPVLNSTPPPLDTDQDGIPDYWETTLGENPTNFSANADRNGDGYTDLEEYMNWLAAPHALTVTNTSVSVDLNVLCGKTGNLSFSVTNGINGSVYLTNVLGSVTNTGTFSNSIAVFTPATNSLGTNFYGYASFDFYVTNNATIASFGPVTVSVMVSAVPVVSGPITLLTTNAPVTNSIVIASNSFAYYSIFAPANADFATNILESASGPLNLWFNQNMLPSGFNPGDFELLTSVSNGIAILTTNAVPPVPTVPAFMPGEFYYLALQNTNNFAVTVTNFALEVDFHLINATNTTVFEFSGVMLTGSSVQLQWSASLGSQVQVQWTTNLVSPIIWNTITNPSVTQSNGVSTFTDDGSQTAPLGEMRFYRLMETSP